MGIVPSAECLGRRLPRWGGCHWGRRSGCPPSVPPALGPSVPHAPSESDPQRHMAPSQFPSGTRHSMPSESVPQWHTGREVTARRPGQYPLAHGPLVPCGVGDGPRTPGSRAVSAPVAHGPFRDRPTGRVSTPWHTGRQPPVGQGSAPAPAHGPMVHRTCSSGQYPWHTGR